MNSIKMANLLLRISIFFMDLASVDVDHTKIVRTKARCGNARAGPIPFGIHLWECIVVSVAALGTGEFMLKNTRPDFFETARRLPFRGTSHSFSSRLQ